MLIIEIVAGRILAPAVGVSLFTWTSIIGITLAGISLGNYLGGRLADRRPSHATLGWVLLAGGIASLCVLPVFALAGLVGPLFDISPLIRLVLLTTLLFFVPSLVLGMVTPVVIKLELDDLARAGNVVGRIYAVSTAGSILGTFAAGFVLIGLIGSRSVLLLVALVLLLLALAFGRVWPARTSRFALLSALAGVAGLAFVVGLVEPACSQESNYFCINVTDEDFGERRLRILTLDALQHSYTDLRDPTFLHYDYEKVFAAVTGYVAESSPRPRALFVGGGGYTLPRYMEAVYPESTLEVIEIDPEVTEVALEHFGLGADTGVISYNEDARMRVPELPEGVYDLVFGDAFNDLSVPYHLTTLEFNEQIASLLRDDGVYAVNVVDKLWSGRFLRSFARTMRETFGHVYVVIVESAWSDHQYSHVVVGSQRPLDADALAPAGDGAGPVPAFETLTYAGLQLLLGGDMGVLLTDDHAPVDNMLVPLFLENR